jgi:hypothetical protein
MSLRAIFPFLVIASPSFFVIASPDLSGRGNLISTSEIASALSCLAMTNGIPLQSLIITFSGVGKLTHGKVDNLGQARY